jgi:NitT/TauT family transport system permease protein
MNFGNLFELRGTPSKSEKGMLEFGGLILLLAIWQILALLVNKVGILPSPFIPLQWASGNGSSSVLTSIPELWYKDLLLKNTLYSLYLNVCGYLIAILVALPLGFIIGLSPIANGIFNKPIDAIRFLPLTAVTGLFIAWFGIQSQMKIFFLAFSIIVYLIPVIVQRVYEVEDVYIQTVKTLGANKWQTIYKVFMPAVLSRVSDDIRVLTAISWTYIVVAELINNEGGIGSLSVRAARQGRLDKAFFVLFVIILLGMLQDKLFRWLDKKTFRFKYEESK